jgi:hypothetical protein
MIIKIKSRLKNYLTVTFSKNIDYQSINLTKPLRNMLANVSAEKLFTQYLEIREV